MKKQTEEKPDQLANTPVPNKVFVARPPRARPLNNPRKLVRTKEEGAYFMAQLDMLRKLHQNT
ncbi:hypothetical protein [Pedobacter gandavensis]|uniref:hypothetical protein n=1 Tax=Pedobacter gandavensis TaxID=2679963 RepID=UPI002930840D|nr:hypothetical protein [Pedobacter gandavensis]